MSIRFVILIVLFPVVSLAQSGLNDKKVDSFVKEQFDFLENQLKMNLDSIDTSSKDFQTALEKQTMAIAFFERLTRIKAEIVAGYVNGKMATQKTIDSWKAWVKENRKLLTWDLSLGTVNRTDGDIYR